MVVKQKKVGSVELMLLDQGSACAARSWRVSADHFCLVTDAKLWLGEQNAGSNAASEGEGSGPVRTHGGIHVCMQRSDKGMRELDILFWLKLLFKSTWAWSPGVLSLSWLAALKNIGDPAQ